jgi:hypothetical protein
MLALRTVRVATSTVRRDLASAGGLRWAPYVGGLRRGGSIGLSHGESPHAAPLRPIDAPARSKVPWPRRRAGTLLDAESTLINRRVVGTDALFNCEGDILTSINASPRSLGAAIRRSHTYTTAASTSDCLAVE